MRNWLGDLYLLLYQYYVFLRDKKFIKQNEISSKVGEIYNEKSKKTQTPILWKE